MRAGGDDTDSILEAFKPDEEPDDAYSVIGLAGTRTGGHRRSGDAYQALQRGRVLPATQPAGRPGIGSGRGGVLVRALSRQRAAD